MNVKLIERKERRATLYHNIPRGSWFAFADEPDVVCRRIAQGGYHREDDHISVFADASTGYKCVHSPVIPLELAGVDGQTLLLQRVGD